ncbi:MAG: PepSY domain-containing protein [Steroidobacteraceae bacterium]
MFRLAGVGALLLCVAGLFNCASALADKNDRRDNNPPRATAVMSRERIIEMAQKRFKARVVRADPIDIGGRPGYQLRLLSDAGRIWTVRVDARTGEQM